MNRSQIVNLVFLFALSCCRFASACSCVGFGPACTEAVSPHATAVFLGTVESIQKAGLGESVDGREMSATFGGGLLEVKLRVQEAYKGVSSDTVSVFTNSSESACGFPFKMGEQYVVYGSEYQGKLFTSICKRTLPVRFAREDLDYLRGMRLLPDTSKIFGNYKRYTFDPNFVPKFTPSIMDHYRPPEEQYEALAAMTGETVTLTSASGQKRRSTIDKEGNFSFVEMPPGKYKIEVTTPAKFSPPVGYVAGLGFRTNAIEVPPKGCAEVVFRTRPDGRIEGRILDAHGRALPNVEVVAWDAEKERGEQFNLYRGASRVHNEPDGRFSLGPLPPGKYKIGAYVWLLPQGFPAMADDRERLTKATLRFVPGTTEFDSAKVVNLELGQHLSNVELNISFDPADWKDIR